MEWTPFAGLTALDDNDSITIDGGSFMIKNPRITDSLLQVGCVTHHHDAHAALPNPTAAPSGAVSPTGGQIAGSLSYALTYTVIDQYGGETIAAPAVLLSTTGGVGEPTIAPSATVDTTTGIMPAGAYYYALTYTDGAGGETTIGPSTFVYVDPGFDSSAVDLSGLTAEFAATGAVTWRLWRSYEGADWHLVSEDSTDTFVDGGFDPPDNPARPPDADNTSQQSSLAMTLPTGGDDPSIAGGSAFRIYLSPDAGFANPCLYAQVPIASGGETLSITSDAVQSGSPPHVSTCTPGARQINPDTDLLNWFWKSPVSTATSLPTSANNDGDVRVTRDTGMIWTWSATTSSWTEWDPGGALVATWQSADYTLQASDAGTVIEFLAGTPTTLTIPPHALVGFAVGTVIEIFQYGPGQVTVAAGAGVTLLSHSAKVHTAAQYATIRLRQRVVDQWVLSGDLA